MSNSQAAQPGPSALPPAREEYTARLAHWEAAGRHWGRRDAAIAAARLATFAVIPVVLWLALRSHLLPVAWVALPSAAFLGLLVAHAVVLRRKRRAEAAAALYRAALDRLDDRWKGHGPTGAEFPAAGHPYAADLDLFGDGSLFQLLCRARTAVGRRILANWLLQPASVAEARARQEAVRELTPALDLREDLAVLGEEGPSRLAAEDLARWRDRPPLLASRPTQAIAITLTLLGIIAGGAWALHLVRATPLLLVLLAEGIFRFRIQREMRQVIGLTDHGLRDLPLLGELLRRLEREPFTSPALQGLHERLESGGLLPSRRLRGLDRLQDCFEARRNPLFAPVVFVLLWEVHFAILLERWRARHGTTVAGWFEVIGEFEAFASLATAAYERPADIFPELAESGPVYEGAGLGHPLLGAGRCVRNDLRLDAAQALLVVSGSNMSGKSTWLRTIGTLHVLAFAGAPVRGERLRVSPLAIGASIRILDSLQDGVSHFAAEVARMKRIVDLAGGSVPVLFLVDEVFQGTNSRDRRVGTEAILRKLLAGGAVGLVTTHDLALTEMVASLGGRAENVHFQDRIVGGEMRFDYRVHPGIIERSNALDLMRAAGLEI